MSETGALTVVFLLGMVGAAYLIAHYVVEMLQRRYLVISGLEYIFLGAVLGPAVVPSVKALADLTALGPVIAFAAGWVGLLYGMELDLRTILGTPDKSWRLAAVDVAFTGSAVGLTAYQVLASRWLVPHATEREAAIAAWALAFTAAAGSSSAVDLVRSRYKALETELLPLLRRSARVGDLLAICGFGLLFCAYHEGATMTARDLVFSEWLVITVLLGTGLGGLFVIFLGDTTEENHRFLALVGILIFASGAAYFVHISALMVNLLLGFVIVLSRHGRGVREVLERTQGPVRLILLVFAGALWTPVDLGSAVALATGYVLIRVMAKSVGGLIATFGTPLRSDLFRGMMAQGDVALAMAIGFKLVYSGPAIDLAYTAILVSVVLHEAVAPRLLKGLLIDAGELRSDVDTRVPAPPRAEGA